jgi:hypothetical protein
MCKTNPISVTGAECRAGLARSGAACRGNPRRGETCRTNPIGSAAQRSQVPCGAGVTEDLTGDGTEKTNPIWTGRTWSARTAVSSVELQVPERSSMAPSDFELQTSNFTLARGRLCKTKPICSGFCTSQVPCRAGVTECLAADGHEETEPIVPGEGGCPVPAGAGSETPRYRDCPGRLSHAGGGRATDSRMRQGVVVTAGEMKQGPAPTVEIASSQGSSQ